MNFRRYRCTVLTNISTDAKAPVKTVSEMPNTDSDMVIETAVSYQVRNVLVIPNYNVIRTYLKGIYS